MKAFFASLLMCAASLFAADINGAWKATAEGPNGSMERTFIFKVDGAKLTGETTSSFVGKSIIEDGKVDGDNLSFTINIKFESNEMKVTYKGKVTGNQIKLTAELPDGNGTIEWSGKKTS